MKERPINFNDEMMRAILEGKKTQTRRVVKPQPHGEFCRYNLHIASEALWSSGDIAKCPYGKPGDKLWVRESWYHNGGSICYKCDYDSEVKRNTRWKPSIHLPRWASRITLEITNVRVERVQEITVGDIDKEGISDPITHYPMGSREFHQRKFESFINLWGNIYDSKGFSWAANPWVWVIEFKRV